MFREAGSDRHVRKAEQTWAVSFRSIQFLNGQSHSTAVHVCACVRACRWSCLCYLCLSVYLWLNLPLQTWIDTLQMLATLKAYGRGTSRNRELGEEVGLEGEEDFPGRCHTVKPYQHVAWQLCHCRAFPEHQDDELPSHTSARQCPWCPSDGRGHHTHPGPDLTSPVQKRLFFYPIPLTFCESHQDFKTKTFFFKGSVTKAKAWGLFIHEIPTWSP